MPACEDHALSCARSLLWCVQAALRAVFSTSRLPSSPGPFFVYVNSPPLFFVYVNSSDSI